MSRPITPARFVPHTVTVLATSALLILSSASLASAASSNYATTADITSLHFTSSSTQSGSDAQIAGTWALPDHPATPAGFSIDLPRELQGRNDKFALTAPDSTPMGTCTVTTLVMDCSMDSAYIDSHPNDLHGDFAFWVTVETQASTSTETRYDIAGHTLTTTVTPAQDGGTCTVDCAFTGRDNYKIGSYNPATGIIDWTVTIGAGPDGMPGGLTVTVTDTPDTNQELIPSIDDEPMPLLWQAPGTYTNSGGVEVIGPWAHAPRDSYTTTLDSVTFTTEQGSFYDVHFATRVTDDGAAGTYTNNATISINGAGSTPVTGTVIHQGGSGTGSGNSPTTPPTPTPTTEPSPAPTSTPTAAATPPARPAGAAVNTGGTISPSPATPLFAGLLGLGTTLLLAVIIRDSRRRIGSHQ